MRISIKLSFEDEESFNDAVGSLHFNLNDPSGDPQLGSSSSLPLQDTDRNTPSDQNILRRVESSSIQEIRRSSGDIQICFNSPPSNPEYTSANSS